VRGELPPACPKHPHNPLPKPPGKCVACEGERQAARDRKSTSRTPWAPWHEAIRGKRSDFGEKAERESRVDARVKGRY
jgi:hypothetical protein